MTSGYAPSPNGTLYYQDSGGTGSAVLFLHAGSGNSSVWEHQIGAFAHAGYRFVAFDRAGHGRSPRSSASNSVSNDDRCDALDHVMNHLGIDRFHLVGVAAGGGVAAGYVLERPTRVLSLVLANSIGGVQDPEYLELGKRLCPPAFHALPLELRELGPSYRAVNPDGVKRWLELSGARGDPSAAPPLAPSVERFITATAATTLAKAREVTFAALAHVRTPTLLLTGDADLYAPPAVLRLFKQHMPHAEFLVVPESGHAAYWENPDVFNRGVLAFLRRH